MRRRLAAHAVPALLGLFACSHYGTVDDAPNGATQDAGPENDAGMSSAVEAGTPIDGGDGGANDAGGVACELVIKQELDSNLLAGWSPTGNGYSFERGPEGMLALKISLTSSGALQRSYVERTIPYAGVRSVHSEFDVAFDQIDPDAAFGCVTNLTRTVPFAEMRLELSRDSTGLNGVSGFSDGTTFSNSEVALLTAPDPHVWTHVTFELSVTSDGTVERKLDFGGQAKTMSSVRTPGSAAYDAIHLLCGVVGLQGENAVAAIWLKSLAVAACRIPP
jgi:hypothetical protein